MQIEIDGKMIDSRDLTDRDLEAHGWGSHAVQRLRDEETPRCEGCENDFDENELDDEGLCEECHNEAGISRAEAWNDLD